MASVLEDSPKCTSCFSVTAAAAATKCSVKKMNFIFIASRSLGCASSSSPAKEPTVLRSAESAEARSALIKNRRHCRDRRTRGRRKPKKASPVIADVCCGPGFLFSSDAAMVDCVQSRRPVAVKMKQREDIVFHFSPLFEDSMTVNRHDRFRDWRLDIDDMTYEELVELGDKIGYESTGLKKHEMFGCLRRAKHRMQESVPLLLNIEGEWKCSICQEDREDVPEEMGRLDCGHCYHIRCIKLWLQHKNSCPICKLPAHLSNRDN